jgi:glycosyltransferase involved in cell wall biosynthesis
MLKNIEKNTKYTLAVIMPAFNEVATISKTINEVLTKKIKNVSIQLIIVESNSSDGTKEIVKKYIHHPRVLVIFEKFPQGKGFAVRKGLAASNSDFIIIQDADSEYDINDYDNLLEPLKNGSANFVLGSRHGKCGWKIRDFKGELIQSFIFNIGHWFFTILIFFLYGVWMNDHATMFKVFKRDCISGIQFKCNRFDFDLELLLKLIKRDFIPVEIPVNYKARSFKEGKKIKFFKDSFLFIRAIFRLRFLDD